MIEVTKDTRTVYTLTLSEDTMRVLLDSLAANPGSGKGAELYQELGRAVLPAEPSVGDTVRVVEDDPSCRTGEFVGKVGKLTAIHELGSRLRYRVEFPASEGAPYATWNVRRVEKVAPEPAPLARGDEIRVKCNNPRNSDGDGATGVFVGDVLTVVAPVPDSDNEIRVQHPTGRRFYLAASGSCAADWERVRSTDG